MSSLLAEPSGAQLKRALTLIEGEEPLQIERASSPYSSSFPLERLRVRRRDGTEVQMAFKRLQWNARAGQCAKPAFLFDPAREPEVYRSLLAGGPPGPARYLGSVATEGGGRWLFVEWIDGNALHEVGEESLWRAAARWLGELHAALAGSDGQACLLVHDADYYGRWLERARRFAVGTAAERFLAGLAPSYQSAVEALATLPRTVIHGDFHAANVLVNEEMGAVRVAPVDWELAAAGPGVIDLAALISGEWSARQRQGMIDAYASAPGVPGFTARDLELARLHLAVQWLGWSPAWEPPAEQRRDWLAEAIAIAQGLGL
jgi:aminoglycoside phosphotransferase (APT) family kinase protein